ncbi:MAG: hypothetical protein ACON4J_03895 [Parvibaculales bacterium]
MKYRTLFVVIGFSFSLGACATSETLKVNDNYTIFKEGGTILLGKYRLSQLKPEALKEAMQLCAKQGKEINIVREDAIPMSIGVFAQYHLTFNCS